MFCLPKHKLLVVKRWHFAHQNITFQWAKPNLLLSDQQKMATEKVAILYLFPDFFSEFQFSCVEKIVIFLYTL